MYNTKIIRCIVLFLVLSSFTLLVYLATYLNVPNLHMGIRDVRTYRMIRGFGYCYERPNPVVIMLTKSFSEIVPCCASNVYDIYELTDDLGGAH